MKLPLLLICSFFAVHAAEPGQFTKDPGLTTAPSLSADGRWLAYVSDRAQAGNLDVWVQELPSGSPRRLTSTPESETSAAPSPDGKFVAYVSPSGLFVLSANGGAPRKLASEGHNPVWSPDGKRIAYWTGVAGSGAPFAPGASGVYVIAVLGGEPAQLFSDIGSARYPRFSPKGTHVLAAGAPNFGVGQQATLGWYVTPVAGGPSVRVNAEVGPYPASLPLGIAWATDGFYYESHPTAGMVTVYRRELRTDGTVPDTPEQVATFPISTYCGAAYASGRLIVALEKREPGVWSLKLDGNKPGTAGAPERVTPPGKFAVAVAGAVDGSRAAWLLPESNTVRAAIHDPAAGTTTELPLPPGVSINNLTISPGGSHIAWVVKGTGYVRPVSGGEPKQICSECPQVTGLSADGKSALLLRYQKGPVTPWRVDLETGKPSPLASNGTAHIWQARLSSNGKLAVFHTPHSASVTHVYVVPFRDQEVPRNEWVRISEKETAHDAPRFSPDGKVVYYTSDQDGYRCVYARRIDPQTGKPLSAEMSVYHSHDPGLSVMNVPLAWFGLGITPQRTFLVLGERRGNLHMVETSRPE